MATEVKVEETTDPKEPYVSDNARVLEYLRARALEVIPATIVCGMAGISEGALRARLKKGTMDALYIHFGLRSIQVVPVEQVVREFFPDGLDEEATEELEFGRRCDSFTPMYGTFLRVLFAGRTDMGAVRRAAMKESYKHGRGNGRGRPEAQE